MTDEIQVERPKQSEFRPTCPRRFREPKSLFAGVVRPVLRGVLVGFLAAACFSTPYFVHPIRIGWAEDMSLAINHTIGVILLAPFLGGALFGLGHLLFGR